MDVLAELVKVRDEPLPSNGSDLGQRILRRQRHLEELINKARDGGYSLQSVAQAAGVSTATVCRILEWSSSD